MTNEKRIVDYREIQKLLVEKYREIKKLIGEGETPLDSLAEGFTEADRLIRDLPVVDAVTVVRCKDCKHYGKTGCAMDTYLFDVVEECFCSYGERKEATPCSK